MKHVLITFLILVVSLTTSNAQRGFELHIGPSFPVGDFAVNDLNSSSAGCAATGFNWGIKYMLPLKQNKLFLNFGMDCFYNEYNSDVKSADPDVDFGTYVNVPFTVGMMFQKTLFNKVSFWGEANMGANVSTITNTTGSYSGSDYTYEIEPANEFCYSVGMGLLLNNRISLGLYYNALGSPKYEYTISGANGYSEKETADALNISTVSFTLGIRLFKSNSAYSNKKVPRTSKVETENAPPKSQHGGKR